MFTPDELKRLKNEAAELLEQWGWQQGWYAHDGPHSPMCLVGAVQKAYFGDPNTELNGPELKQLQEDLGIEDVVAWNDTPGRTKEEILAVLRS